MNSQFTIRLDDTTNEHSIEAAQALGITRATLVRNALTSYLNKSNPNKDSEIVGVLKEQLAKAHKQIEASSEAKSRTDVITMELTRTLQNQQKQLQDLTAPRTLWQKLFTVFN